MCKNGSLLSIFENSQSYWKRRDTGVYTMSKGTMNFDLKIDEKPEIETR